MLDNTLFESLCISICFFFCLGCVVSNTNPTGESCDCSGNTCADDEFCYDGVCNANAKSNFIFKTRFLLFWKINVFWICCSIYWKIMHLKNFCCCCCLGCVVSNTNPTGEVCDCSGNTCADDEFCYDGVCNANAKSNFIFKIQFLLFWKLVFLWICCSLYWKVMHVKIFFVVVV